MEPYKAVVVGGALNLRREPAKSSDRILQIPEGAIVTVDEELEDWSHVEYMARQGYVMSVYLSRMDDLPLGDDQVGVPRNELQRIYDEIGDWLGLRG